MSDNIYYISLTTVIYDIDTSCDENNKHLDIVVFVYDNKVPCTNQHFRTPGKRTSIVAQRFNF